MLQGRDWSAERCPDPAGWFISEKFRGCRAEWDGTHLWSKEGNRILAPPWLIEGLPIMFRLTFEIWAGRVEVETKARLATQYGHFQSGLHKLVLLDCPTAGGNIVDRLDVAAASIDPKSPHVLPLTLDVCTGLDDLIARLQAVQRAGGEGLMLHHPTAPWKAGRTDTLLKVKHPSTLLCAAAIA